MLKIKTAPLEHRSEDHISGVLTIPRLVWNSWLDAGFDAVEFFYENDMLLLKPKKETK